MHIKDETDTEVKPTVLIPEVKSDESDQESVENGKADAEPEQDPLEDFPLDETVNIQLGF